MKQTQKAMKLINTAAKGMMIAAAILLMTAGSLVAQTGKVWASVSNLEALKLTKGDATLQSADAAVNAMLTSMNVQSIEKAFPATRSRELMNVVEITCACDAQDLLQAVTKVNAFSAPEVAATTEALFTPNDFSTAIANDYALNLIGAQAAWDVTRGDSSIVIAITDANFHLNHEELAGKYTVVSPNGSTDYTHGTAVAITAAGRTNNLVGKSSIGYNSTLQLRSMSYNQVLEATYAGARVINMSWVASCTFSTYGQQVITEAWANGSVLVAAAGNGSTCGGAANLVYPAAFDHVIAVSSVGPYDNHERTMGNPSTTHQHNASVDICAPGYDVALSTAPGVYLTGNGTSFAAPMVSGTIALMLATNPCLTADQVEMILEATAVNIDAQNPAYVGQLGAGRLNAGAAVAMAATFSTTALTGETTFVCEDMSQGVALDMTTIAAPYSIVWNTGDTTASINNVAAGTYSAIVRDANGCVGFFATAVDTLAPIAIASTVAPVMCNADNTGNIEITVTGGHGSFAYAWNTGATTDAIYNLTAGTYAVTVSDSKGCTTSETFTVAQPTVLVAEITNTNAFYTHTTGVVDVTVEGGVAPYTYSWNNGTTTQDITEAATGFYEVLITDANGCIVSANATVNAAGVTEAINGQYTVVEGADDEGTEIENAAVTEIEATTMNVYPNPATENATVIWENGTVQSIELVNMAGQVIQTIEVNAFNNKAELTAVAQGDYLVKMTTVEGTTVIKKVIFL
jgi:hypothetical protein